MKQRNPHIITENKKARFEYSLSDLLECGLCLLGWEVKSLRAGRVQLNDSHVIIRKHEAWLLGSVITPLPNATSHSECDQTRTRKLLLHSNELAKLIGQVERKGYTIMPVSMYWKHNRVKLKIALGKGKKTHDKRATIKEREWKRSQQRSYKLA